MGERVTQAEAARRLKLNRSTVTRQVRKFGLLGDDKRLDLDDYVAARDGVLNPAQTKPAEAAAAAKPAEPSELQRAALREKKAAAEIQEHRLATLRGDYVERRRVEAAAFDLARRTRDALMRLSRELAAELAEETDPRQVRAKLEAAIRERLTELTDSDDAGDPEERAAA